MSGVKQLAISETQKLGKKASRSDINAAVQEAAAGPMERVVEYSEAPLVSSDIIGNTHSSIFDALSTHSQEDGYARLVSWYDNEWGYSNRVVDLIEMLAAVSKQDSIHEPPASIRFVPIKHALAVTVEPFKFSSR
jgi:glyceraldehyde-3-phosphate dehydrogenase/erythrose-4-phosphate dehydrogenase